MPFQSAPNCAEAVIQASFDSKSIANVLNFQKAGGYDQTDITALAAAVDLAVGTNYLAKVGSGVHYSGTLVRGLESIIDLTDTASSEAGDGALATTALPSNVSLCIGLKTGKTGRSARGRFYAFPTAAAQQDTVNTFLSSYGDALVDFLEQVKTNAAAENWTLSILSRVSGGVRRSTAIATPVTSISYRNLTIDSQRHRLPKGH